MNQIKQISNNRTVSEFNINNTVFLVRHGECVSNITWPMDNYTDEIDVLTEQGKSQIKNLLKYFNQFDVEYKIISSTLTRAKQSAQILNTGISKSILQEPDLRIVEKNHEEQIDDFKTRIDSFFTERISSNGPWIIVMHGHVIETLILQKLNAPYVLVEKDNHTLGIPGIWGIANGSISATIDNNFIFFNFVP
jgi:broad specificity phosphatase PhoE